jgi:3-deoxy-7-phosphoheptulonate synthase
MAKAGISAGADGIMVEVHPNPEEALCDGEQSLRFSGFSQLVKELTEVAGTVDKKLVG